jgi:hypothetical protein
VGLLPAISDWPERRPQRTESERHEIAEKFAAHLPKHINKCVITERDINAMRAAFIARFDEQLPRTETLFKVASVGYRMALRDLASGMSAGTAETQSGSGLQPASPTSQSEGTPNPKGNPGPPGVRS